MMPTIINDNNNLTSEASLPITRKKSMRGSTRHTPADNNTDLMANPDTYSRRNNQSALISSPLELIPPGCEVPPSWPPPPTWWDLVVVAISGGIDSQAMLLKALEIYPPERIVALFCDTGDDHTAHNRLIPPTAIKKPLPSVSFTQAPFLESNAASDWAGTEAFIRSECADLAVPLIIARSRTILELTRARGWWSSSASRLCTSTTKRATADTALRNFDKWVAVEEEERSINQADYAGLHTAPLLLTRGKTKLELQPVGSGLDSSAKAGYCLTPIEQSLIRTEATPHNPGLVNLFQRWHSARRILFLTGELAEESAARAKKPEWELRTGATAYTKGRLVMWHRPMLRWAKADEIVYVWSRGRDIAPTYYHGWDRFSCRFCFFLTFERQILSFVAYPYAAAQFVATEAAINHKVNLQYKFEGEVGYLAVWRFVYGQDCDWRTVLAGGGEEGRGAILPEPLPRAGAVVDKLGRVAQELLEKLRAGEKVSWKRCGGCA